MRLNYPRSVRIIRVPCTGKVDVLHLLHSFEKGADGVMTVGCMEGDCHFTSGNFRARKRVEQAKAVLKTIGIEPERVEMFNLSSAEGPRFAEYVRQMDERIRALGPNPLRKSLKKAA